MVEPGDQLAVTCPSCSPAAAVRHEVLADGGEPTVRCLSCEQVHTARVDEGGGTRTVRTVVSQDGDSLTASLEVPRDVDLETGRGLVVETEDAVFSVEITSLEDDAGRRHEALPATDVATVWTRDVGNVAVAVTIHPPGGGRSESRSATMHVPGDRAFAVGDEETVDDEPVRITGIHLRGDAAEPDGRRRLDEPGERALARDVHRVYVRSKRRAARSPW